MSYCELGVGGGRGGRWVGGIELAVSQGLGRWVG